MRLLLDTHTFLWFAWGSPQLSGQARSLIEDPANEKFVSIASLWEIAIKISLGNLALAKPLDDFLTEHLEGNGFEILLVSRAHVLHVATLPFHHRDPFDRLVVAQSLLEPLALVSADSTFDIYGVSRLW